MLEPRIPYDFQGFSHHKHYIGIGDHLWAFNEVPSDNKHKHGMCLDEGFRRKQDHLDGWVVVLGVLEKLQSGLSAGSKLLRSDSKKVTCVGKASSAIQFPPPTDKSQCFHD